MNIGLNPGPRARTVKPGPRRCSHTILYSTQLAAVAKLQSHLTRCTAGRAVPKVYCLGTPMSSGPQIRNIIIIMQLAVYLYMVRYIDTDISE